LRPKPIENILSKEDLIDPICCKTHQLSNILNNENHFKSMIVINSLSKSKINQNQTQKNGSQHLVVGDP